MGKSSWYLFGVIFSFAGFIFLTIVGALLKLQPKFVRNAKSPSSTANACFEAGFLYALAMSGCYVLWRREKVRAGELGLISESFSLREKTYLDLEDSDEELPLAQNMSPAVTPSPTKHLD